QLENAFQFASREGRKVAEPVDQAAGRHLPLLRARPARGFVRDKDTLLEFGDPRTEGKSVTLAAQDETIHFDRGPRDKTKFGGIDVGVVLARDPAKLTAGAKAESPTASFLQTHQKRLGRLFALWVLYLDINLGEDSQIV